MPLLMLRKERRGFKIWLKPPAEQRFLYGHHVLKSGVARVSEGLIRNEGVIMFNMNNVPLGFGVAAKDITALRRSDPSAIVAYNQADVGEYIRHEDFLT